MEAVQRFLSQLLHAHRFGCRTVLRDEKTLIVYDCPNWGEREFSALRAKFPDCDVAVHACESSLSGFCVIVTRRAEAWCFASELAFILTVGGMLWTVWFLYRSMLSKSAVDPTNI
jgi:hypothetical protein